MKVLIHEAALATPTGSLGCIHCGEQEVGEGEHDPPLQRRWHVAVYVLHRLGLELAASCAASWMVLQLIATV